MISTPGMMSTQSTPAQLRGSSARPPVETNMAGAQSVQNPASSPEIKTASTTVQFSGEPTPPGAVTSPVAHACPPPPTSTPGFTQTVQALRDYWAHGANRDITKALAYKYAPDLLIPAALMLPFGWALAVVGFVPAWLMSKRGDRMVETLEQNGRLSGTNGPLARITRMSHLWDLAQDTSIKDNVVANTPHKLMDEFNRLIAEVFPDSAGQSAKIIRDRLSITQQGKAFRWLNHTFNARQMYARSLPGKLFSPLRHLGNRIPFRPLRLIFVLPDLMMMGLYALTKSGKIRAMARKL